MTDSSYDPHPTYEAIANRIVEQISEMEQPLLERCLQLIDRAKTIRNP